MKRLVMSCSVALSLVALSASVAQAEVKTRERSQVKFEGMLGRVIGMFGGKAAREGIVSSNAVKGDRKATMTDSSGRIVDLSEEKVYDLDLKKKTYKVTTFAELRQQLKEAQEKAQRDAEKAAREEKEEKEEKPAGEKEKAPEMQVDFDLKETGQKKSIAGYDAREVIATITVYEKGKTLEESGGLVVTSDMWLGPEIPAMKELADFEMRYWKAIAPETTGVSPEQMAAVLAMYPLVKQGMERLNQEKVSLKGTPLATDTTFEAVKSKEQLAQESESSSSSGGGIGGMLARKVMKKEEPKARATIFTISGETLELSTTVTAADLEIPAGFKQTK
jgi:hypothetical protein